jgi:hypothetical protein
MEKKKKTNERVIGEIEANGHSYEFAVLDTLHALGVYHQWLTYLGKDVDKIVEAVRDMLSESKEISAPELFKNLISGDDSYLKLREFLIKTLTIPRLFELCATFLSGAKIDGEECDDMGMCPLFRKQPHEVYTALMFAIGVNYPDYFPFVLTRSDTGESPSQE